jgi:hypothetical protein
MSRCAMGVVGGDPVMLDKNAHNQGVADRMMKSEWFMFALALFVVSLASLSAEVRDIRFRDSVPCR